MDLAGMIQNSAEQQGTGQRMSKEEYAAMKKQERDDTWMRIDAKAQEVFRDGESLQKFLDFMAGQYNMPRVPNLLLLYSQNPEVNLVRSREEWRRENRYPQPDAKEYTYIIQTEYEKDGVTRQGYTIGKGYDVAETSGKPTEERPKQDIQTLLSSVLKNQEVRLQVADQLPDGVQAQYIPKQRTIYIRNGMSEVTTFHAVSRELSCARLDQHDGSYKRNKVNAQAYCATYVVGIYYGIDVSGFNLGAVAGMQENGQKDPQELRSFLNDVRNAAYSIRGHINRELREPEQEFVADNLFSVGEGEKSVKSKKGKEQPER